MARDGWSALFSTAFKQSKNSMALVDEQRRHVDVNNAYLRLLGHARDDVIGRPVAEFLVGGPLMSPAQWAAALAAGHFMGEAQMIRADGSTVDVQWAGHTEVVTGQRLVLFVALSTSRWGSSFRRTADADGDPRDLSARELEIVRLIARGESGPEIAAELHIAHDTVRTHVRNAMKKVGARSRAHLVAKVLGNGDVLG
ncbi:MAG TPA: PAS and helix-turn-helix domain-containing protein [Solirubrobacteraceae bacterium]|nr:PAS and helix-turn-helix domain-containing protein [Solirubrobacteraceae bacterium]